MRIASIVCAGWVVASAGQAEAATCAFDQGSGVLTVVTGTGGASASLRVVAGAIELGGAPCGAATSSNTARIVVNPGGMDEGNLTLIGRFAPGRNDEPDPGRPEIEIDAGNLDGEVTINGTSVADVWRFTGNGIDLNDDGDEDLALSTMPAGSDLLLRPGNGDDVVDASAWAKPLGVAVRGGAGNDVITGSPSHDRLYGADGNDTLAGGGGNDYFNDGAGDDLVRGNAGNDTFWPFPDPNLGRDDYRGGAGIDEIAYVDRVSSIGLALDGIANDGQPGENDNVRPDVEDVWGGAGNDILVGSSAANHLRGMEGTNELYGGAGDDVLDCFDGVGNILVGDAGNDDLTGSPDGGDFLDGGEGDDLLSGWAGNDTLDGGPGVDVFDGGFGDDVIFNDDGFADTVDCGPGTDDPEPDPLDTFTACENI